MPAAGRRPSSVVASPLRGCDLPASLHAAPHTRLRSSIPAPPLTTALGPTVPACRASFPPLRPCIPALRPSSRLPCDQRRIQGSLSLFPSMQSFNIHCPNAAASEEDIFPISYSMPDQNYNPVKWRRRYISGSLYLIGEPLLLVKLPRRGTIVDWSQVCKVQEESRFLLLRIFMLCCATEIWDVQPSVLFSGILMMCFL